MKLKLDENLPTDLVDLLVPHGHDVHTVPGESLSGRDDTTVFNAARGEGRMLFTQDLDFSDIRKFQPGTHPKNRSHPAPRPQPPQLGRAIAAGIGDRVH